MEAYRLALPELMEYIGDYPPRHVWLETDGLHYQREGEPEYRLLPAGRDLFFLDGEHDTEIRFGRAEDGRVDRLTCLSSDGGSFLSHRVR